MGLAAAALCFAFLVGGARARADLADADGGGFHEDCSGGRHADEPHETRRRFLRVRPGCPVAERRASSSECFSFLPISTSSWSSGSGAPSRFRAAYIARAMPTRSRTASAGSASGRDIGSPSVRRPGPASIAAARGSNLLEISDRYPGAGTSAKEAANETTTSRSGGTGRRGGLKIRFPQGSVSSSLTFGTSERSSMGRASPSLRRLRRLRGRRSRCGGRGLVAVHQTLPARD
jgi:hypothetical protein